MNILSYIQFLLKKKRLFLWNFLFISLIAWIYCFFIAKKEYLAEITFLPPASNEISASTAMFGFSLPNLSSPNILSEQIYTIFESNATKRSIINHFDLYQKFKLTKSKNKFELAKKRLNKLISMDLNQTSSLGFQQNTISFSIQCYSTSPDTAALMANYSFSLVDSAIQRISIDRASRNRMFVESQLLKSKSTLDSLETAFEVFQKENKAYVMPEQLKLSLNSYASIKANALLTEMQIRSIQRERDSSQQIQDLQKNLSVLNEKMKSIETSESPSVLPGLNLSAKLIPKFTNLTRDIEAQDQIILFLIKEVEQARIQEAKNVSSLVVIDPAVRPEYKIRPKRLPVMAMIILLETGFLIIILTYQFTFNFALEHNQKFSDFIKILHGKKT